MADYQHCRCGHEKLAHYYRRPKEPNDVSWKFYAECQVDGCDCRHYKARSKW